jgi:hypothetical protein
MCDTSWDPVSVVILTLILVGMQFSEFWNESYKESSLEVKFFTHDELPVPIRPS